MEEFTIEEKRKLESINLPQIEGEIKTLGNSLKLIQKKVGEYFPMIFGKVDKFVSDLNTLQTDVGSLNIPSIVRNVDRITNDFLRLEGLVHRLQSTGGDLSILRSEISNCLQITATLNDEFRHFKTTFNSSLTNSVGTFYPKIISLSTHILDYNSVKYDDKVCYVVTSNGSITLPIYRCHHYEVFNAGRGTVTFSLDLEGEHYIIGGNGISHGNSIPLFPGQRFLCRDMNTNGYATGPYGNDMMSFYIYIEDAVSVLTTR